MCGASSDDARWTAESLIGAAVSGHPSDGVQRVIEHATACLAGTVDPAAQPVIRPVTRVIVDVDGCHGLGQVVARAAADACVEIARAEGLGLAFVRHCGMLGRLSDVVERIADGGCVGIVAANAAGAGQVVAPPGTRAARLSTNPIAIAVPRAAPPHFVFDMATSVVSWGTLLHQRAAGLEIPFEWLAETDSGEPALLPAAGHKGFGLALAVEIAAGVLTGAGHSREGQGEASEQGVVVAALDPSCLPVSGTFVDDVESMLAYVRSAPAAPGSTVRFPGEGSWERRSRDGAIVEVERGVWDALLATAARAGIRPPRPRTAQ